MHRLRFPNSALIGSALAADVSMAARSAFFSIMDKAAAGSVAQANSSGPVYTALINQNRPSLRSSSIGFLNPALHAIGTGPPRNYFRANAPGAPAGRR
jgi:hypothetical protein